MRERQNVSEREGAVVVFRRGRENEERKRERGGRRGKQRISSSSCEWC